MDDISNAFDFVDASFEQGDLVCDAAFPQLVDTKSQLGYGRKGNGAKEVSMRVNDKSILLRSWRMQTAFVDEIGVHHGIISGPMLDLPENRLRNKKG